MKFKYNERANLAKKNLLPVIGRDRKISLLPLQNIETEKDIHIQKPYNEKADIYSLM